MKALVTSIQEEIKQLEMNKDESTTYEIPIIYGDEFGPDLQDLLEYYKLTKDEFIQLHSDNAYFVSIIILVYICDKLLRCQIYKDVFLDK